jgi:hypothetical protein
MNSSRRDVLLGATGIIILAAGRGIDSAEAFAWGAIGGALLPALGGIVAQNAISGVIQQGVGLAARAAQVAAPALGNIAPLVSTATQLLQPNSLRSTQAAPIYVNPGPEQQNLSLFSRAPSRPWQLGDSDEQYLRGDPYGYISQNAGTLGDFIRSSPGDVVPLTYRAAGAQQGGGGRLIPAWGIAPIAFQGQPRSRSFYPSVTSPSGDFNELLKNIAALAPLISMFLSK